MNNHLYWNVDNRLTLQDYGPRPLVVNMEEAAKLNHTYRTALWTGKHLQVTVMSIHTRDDIGLEVHPDTDQFISIEEGQGLVQMGDSRDDLDFSAEAGEGYAIMIPAGKWHNVTNTGNKPLKIFVVYAPPNHPFGTEAFFETHRVDHSFYDHAFRATDTSRMVRYIMMR